MLVLDTKADFDALIKSEKLTVVDFYAQWCGPCRVISPKIEQMAKEFTEVQFAKVDVDENEETAESCGISAMPTFILYKDGKKVDQLTGANEGKLKELINKYK